MCGTCTCSAWKLEKVPQLDDGTFQTGNQKGRIVEKFIFLSMPILNFV